MKNKKFEQSACKQLIQCFHPNLYSSYRNLSDRDCMTRCHFRIKMKLSEAQTNFYKLFCNSASGQGSVPPSAQAFADTLIKPDDIPGHLCKMISSASPCQLEPNITFGFWLDWLHCLASGTKISPLIAKPSRGIIFSNCRHFLGSIAVLEEPRSVI